MSEEYSLKDEIGQIEPIIEAKDGTIVDGRHREAEGMTWKVQNPNIDTPFKVACAQLIANSNRRLVEPAEKTALLAKAYEEYKIEHGEFPKAADMAKLIGRDVCFISRYLPAEYKRSGGYEPANVQPAYSGNPPSLHDTPRRETNGEVMLHTILEQAGFEVEKGGEEIRYNELHCLRCGTDWERDGGNCPKCGGEGITKTYDADLIAFKSIPIEVMGEGSSSDDPKRDAYFEQKYGTSPLKFTNREVHSKLCRRLIIDNVFLKRQLMAWRGKK